MTNPIVLVPVGVLVGIFAGLMGLGGGTLMIPIMVLLLGLNQTTAHGTSLAVMVFPVTLPAVIRYYQKGNLNLPVAAWIALGAIGGSYLGAIIANAVNSETLKLIFGFVLIYAASYTIFAKGNIPRAMLISAGMVLIALLAFLLLHWHDTTAGGTL